MIKLLKEQILIEDIASVRKMYPDIPEDIFMQLIKLDPTYREGSSSVGTYGKWILNLYKRGNLKEEDFYKVSDYLARFNDYKKDITPQFRDINKFKTLPDLYNFLAQTEQSFEQEGRGLTDRAKLRRIQKNIHNTNISKDAQKVFEDEYWEVWVPKTYEASCKLGQGTEWCTATASDRRYYDMYSKQGPLFININKKDPSKRYQFHFESGSFMDESDRAVNPLTITRADDDLFLFYVPYFNKMLGIESGDEYVQVKVPISRVANALSNRNISANTLISIFYDDDIFLDSGIRDESDYTFLYDSLDGESIDLIKSTGHDISDDDVLPILLDAADISMRRVLMDTAQNYIMEQIKEAFPRDTDVQLDLENGDLIFTVKSDFLYAAMEGDVDELDAISLITWVLSEDVHLQDIVDIVSYRSTFDEELFNYIFRDLME